MPVVVSPDDGTTGNKCPAAGGGDTNKCHSVEHGGVDTVNMGPNLSHLGTHGPPQSFYSITLTITWMMLYCSGNLVQVSTHSVKFELFF